MLLIYNSREKSIPSRNLQRTSHLGKQCLVKCMALFPFCFSPPPRMHKSMHTAANFSAFNPSEADQALQDSHASYLVCWQIIQAECISKPSRHYFPSKSSSHATLPDFGEFTVLMVLWPLFHSSALSSSLVWVSSTPPSDSLMEIVFLTWQSQAQKDAIVDDRAFASDTDWSCFLTLVLGLASQCQISRIHLFLESASWGGGGIKNTLQN